MKLSPISTTDIVILFILFSALVYVSIQYKRQGVIIGPSTSLQQTHPSLPSITLIASLGMHPSHSNIKATIGGKTYTWSKGSIAATMFKAFKKPLTPGTQLTKVVPNINQDHWIIWRKIDGDTALITIRKKNNCYNLSIFDEARKMYEMFDNDDCLF